MKKSNPKKKKINKKRFWLGVVIFGASYPIGFFSILGMAFKNTRIYGIIGYAITWGMILIGTYLAGKEGINYVKSRLYFWRKKKKKKIY